MAVATESRPRGEARDRDDELIALLVLISATDLQFAAQTWDAIMPRHWRGLLYAEPIEDVRSRAGKLPPIWFDIKTQRYGLGAKGFITEPATINALETFRAKTKKKQRDDLLLLWDGGDVGRWHVQMESDLKLYAIATVALAVGGIERMAADTIAAVSESLTFHLKRLARFAREIEGGLIEMEAAAKRAEMYPTSIVTDNYDTNRRASHIAAGFKEELNVLADSDHCETTPDTPGCADLTELGWSPIGTLPPPGKRTCVMNCRCHLVYRRNEAESN